MKRHLWLKGSLLIMSLLFLTTNMQAQRIALKSNALLWATLSPNVGAEFRVSRRFTISTEVAANPFSLGKLEPHYALFQPEVRYWFSNRPHARWFVGVAGLASIYKMRFGDTYHDGNAVGGGVTGGYSFVLNRRWSLETTLGLGLVRISERKWDVSQPFPGNIMPEEPNNKKIMPFPIKAGVTFVYIL